MDNLQYNIIAENHNTTVVSEYTPVEKNALEYQTENALEKECIRMLQENGYEYNAIKNNNALLENLRIQISKLNSVDFSDAEWQQLCSNYLIRKNEGIEEKANKIQEDYIYSLKCDDGTTKNIIIIDKENIHKNHLQVINQYETDEGTYKNRYDITILVNGLPLVHVELKRRDVAICEAFNQINRYQRESFWADSGLFEYVQLFVISNGTNTKYYSNTIRKTHIKEKDNTSSTRKTSNSFEFTSWWTDAQNKRIPDLIDFTKTFFSKHTLLSILTKYCVFTSDKLLLVMRPYQIVASERILNKIVMATNHKQLGTVEAGGYIWHTTGSGKTLTSFKTAQLATTVNSIEKVLFVVDRKDLDYQTMKEYDKFQKGAANSNTSTKILTEQLANPNVKIIITTIQKLSNFISANKGHTIFEKHIVLIFDECHRSQFGDMHIAIKKAFKKYHMFGFTGTPIFAKNSSSGGKAVLKTTEQAFGKKLHSYTIVDAINDNNVLKFRIDYLNTLKIKEGVQDKKVSAINTEEALDSPKRIAKITTYILEHFNQKTRRDAKSYSFNKLTNIKETVKNKGKEIDEKRERVTLKGFNSIFAVSSIEVAKKYYAEFKSKNTELKIAIIYSFSANEEENEDGILQDEDFDTRRLDTSSRDFLEGAIKDYNTNFGTNYNTSADQFENYYKDISQRMKNREIDLLLVVNMFLTGFDATTLNTLWVDKNLRYHGLLQAFSRTNRILNSVKTYGNIVCFRDLEQATNEALAMFGNKDTSSIVLLKSYNEYYNGYEQDGKQQKGYVELIADLQSNFSLPLIFTGEESEKDFISLWGKILRIRNILVSFDDFDGNEIVSKRTLQDYQSIYLDLYDKYRKNSKIEKENINDDIEFEIELVKQVTINIDYILQLIAQYAKTHAQDKEILITIDKAITSSIELRSKKELIENFINSLNTDSDIYNDWHTFAKESMRAELEGIIKEENLKPEKTQKFIETAFQNGELKSVGDEFPAILPPLSRFAENSIYTKKSRSIFEKLKIFFEKYCGI